MHLVAIGGSDAGISAALRARERGPGDRPEEPCAARIDAHSRGSVVIRRQLAEELCRVGSLATMASRFCLNSA
jgi:hypothetical protein